MQVKIGFGLMFVLMVVLIVALVVNIRKRKAAEKSLTNADAKLENVTTE